MVLLLLASLLGGGYALDALRSPATGTHPAPTSSGGAASPATVTPSAEASAPAGMAVVPLSQLPPQAADTYHLVLRGGPFPYSRDGVVFGNRERLLPQHSSGYYHEYTVPTPASNDRGARRLVVGAAGEVYYTADHYASFRFVDVTR